MEHPDKARRMGRRAHRLEPDPATVPVVAWMFAQRPSWSGTRVRVLLHGHPRTHATWNKVAPLLAERFTVVCPDLRGYGESSKPATTPDHAPYSKGAMAGDCVALMTALGPLGRLRAHPSIGSFARVGRVVWPCRCAS